MFGLRLQHLVGVLSFPLVWASLGPNDPVVVGQTFLANSLDPTDGSVPWALISHGVAEKLFTVDQDGEIIPQVAESVSKVSDFAWEVTLKPGYLFSDGTPVTAQHVADCLNEQNEQNSNAQSSLGTMTVSASSDLVVKIHSERQTHVMNAVLAEFAFVIYFEDSGGNFVFTGPFVVENYASDQIDLIPNEFYPQSAERPQIKLKKFNDGHDLAEAVRKNNVDIGFHLPIDTLPELRRTEGVHVKSFEVGYHYMMFYNMDTLQDEDVRKAIDLAIDRNALSQALAGGHATRSLFPDNSPFFSDDSDPHGDKSAAEALLDEAGWTLNSSGKRTNSAGEALTVKLVAYPHRPGLVIMQPVIKESLTALGITADAIVTGQEWGETQKIIDERSFDLLMWAQHTLPAGDPLFFLNAFFRSDGGSNHAKVSSASIDSHLDTLSLAEEHNERVLLSQAAMESILQLVPVSNLVTPFWHVGLSERMKDYKPWGSDYYVIRSDLLAPPKIAQDESGSPEFGPGLSASVAVLLTLSMIGLIL